MSDLIEPINNGTTQEITVKRGITVHRMRETQPALNAPAQDTIPGSGSGDA